jgi:folate-binding protein YgfZ
MLTEAHKRDKVSLTHIFGVEYPSWFVHPAAEYQALTRYAGVIDLTHWPVYRATGKDRISFLNAMLTNDVASVTTGGGCHALLTTIKGKIVAELFIIVRDEDVLIHLGQGDAPETLSILQKHIVMEDVAIENISDAFSVIALEGPKTEEILWRLFQKGPFPKEPLQFFQREFDDGIECTLIANSITGEPGVHMMVPASFAQTFWEYTVQAARGSDGLPVGSIAWNLRRTENGMPWFGRDFSTDNFPDETRLGHTISYDKGCFRGQETLARLHHRGHVNRVLVGLTPADPSDDTVTPTVDGRINSSSATKRSPLVEFDLEINNYDEPGLKARAPRLAEKLELSAPYVTNTELYLPDGASSRPIGHLTTAVYSPQLRQPLLLGYVRRETAEAGGTVLLDDAVPLRIIDLPLAGP